MLNYTTATIEGNATHDPQLKKTKTGKSVCHFTIATNHWSKYDESVKVSFIDVETWEKTAEICSKNIVKGKRVMVIGALRQDRWEDEQGKTHSRLKIVGNEVRFLETIKSTSEAQEAAV